MRPSTRHWSNADVVDRSTPSNPEGGDDRLPYNAFVLPIVGGSIVICPKYAGRRATGDRSRGVPLTLIIHAIHSVGARSAANLNGLA